MAEPWVFIRGLAREIAHWDDFPVRFSEQLGVPTHCLDLPGVGERFREDSPSTIPAIAADLRSRARARFPTGDYNLFAISLGGMIAVEWMRQYASEISRAVLINTSLRGVSPIYHRLSPGAWAPLLRAFLQTDPAARENLVFKMVSSDPDAKAGLLPGRVRSAVDHPLSRKNFIRQLAAASRYRAPKDAPSKNVLLLHSLGDRLADPMCSARLAARWGWERKTHASAGHDLVLDDPQWCIVAVKDWLATRRATA